MKVDRGGRERLWTGIEGTADANSSMVERLARETIQGDTLTDPAGYRPSPEARDAVNVALLLGTPLLISGEPGSGKTQLGYAVAHELGLDTPELFVTKSGSQARDLFYHYDALRHFHSAQTGRGAEAGPFIHLHALGRAINQALAPEHRLPLGAESAARFPPATLACHRRRSRQGAPRLPNDLLYEFDQLRFRIPELGDFESPPSIRASAPFCSSPPTPSNCFRKPSFAAAPFCIWRRRGGPSSRRSSSVVSRAFSRPTIPWFETSSTYRTGSGAEARSSTLRAARNCYSSYPRFWPPAVRPPKGFPTSRSRSRPSSLCWRNRSPIRLECDRNSRPGRCRDSISRITTG